MIWHKGKPEKTGEYLVAYTFKHYPTSYAVIGFNEITKQWTLQGTNDGDIILATKPNYWTYIPELEGSEIDEM